MEKSRSNLRSGEEFMEGDRYRGKCRELEKRLQGTQEKY